MLGLKFSTSLITRYECSKRNFWNSTDYELGGYSLSRSWYSSYTNFFIDLWRRPRFKLDYSVDYVSRTDPQRKYGYLNLIVRNTGKLPANCIVEMAIPELKFPSRTLWQLDPRDKLTTKHEQTTIRGGQRQVCNIFEIDMGHTSTKIDTQQGYVAELFVRESYSLRFEVHSDTPARATLDLKVKISDWNDIQVQKRV